MDNLPVPASSNPFDNHILQALQAGLSIEVLERLYLMHSEHEARAAEKEFTRCMAALQAEMPPIYKTMKGAKARYAPIDEIVTKLQPFLLKYGFSYKIEVEKLEGDWLNITCIVKHIAGHTERTSAPIPMLEVVTSSGGYPVTNETQAVAGTMTYGKRYALCNAFGLVAVDPDFDGATPVDIPALVKQVEELTEKVPDGKMRVDEVLVKRGVTSISELRPNVLVYLINYFQKKLEAHE